MIGFQAGDEVQWANGARSGVFLRYVIINNEVWGYLVNSIFLPASLLSRYENYFTRRVPAPCDPGPLPQSGLAICKRDPLLAPDHRASVQVKDERHYIGSGVFASFANGLIKLTTPRAEIWLDVSACDVLYDYAQSLKDPWGNECPF